jgi:hypothetical protein
MSAQAWRSTYLTNGTFASAQLPKNVALLTLRRWNGRHSLYCARCALYVVSHVLLWCAPETCLLVRLGHQFGVGEDASMSQPVTVDLAALFSRVEVRVRVRVHCRCTREMIS